jgi:hypothetical protein
MIGEFEAPEWVVEPPRWGNRGGLAVAARTLFRRHHRHDTFDRLICERH